MNEFALFVDFGRGVLRRPLLQPPQERLCLRLRESDGRLRLLVGDAEEDVRYAPGDAAPYLLVFSIS